MLNIYKIKKIKYQEEIKKRLFEFRAKKKVVNFVCFSANFDLQPPCGTSAVNISPQEYYDEII